MYTVTKKIEISGAHKLQLSYKSKCNKLHGHNWIIYVTCKRDTLNKDGMVIDFTKIKEVVDQLDHEDINEILGNINPTAENIAHWIAEQIPYCVKVKVQESEGNVAIFEY